MSVVNMEQPSARAGRQNRAIELPASIEETLVSVIRQNRRAELVRSLAVLTAAGLLLLIGLVVADLQLSLHWTPVRWAIWITVLCISAFSIRKCLVRLREECGWSLEAAWKIESAHPTLEERLTSTVQFLEDKSSQLHTSSQLINALVAETNEGVTSIDAESIPRRSTWLPMSVAGLLAALLTFAIAMWPQSVLTSIGNLATPWSTYAVPTLTVQLSPGDITIAEGESVTIRAFAGDLLVDPLIEIIRGDIVESHLMSTTTEESTFTLSDVRRSLSYRIRSGGLYSVTHSVTVHPRPQLSSVQCRLSFPEYTHLAPITIKQIVKPIDVPAGTEVILTAVSDTTAAEGSIRWKSETEEFFARRVTSETVGDQVHFEWALKVEPELNLVGSLQVRSEHGVGSVAYPVQIRASDDLSPSIEITAPHLRQMAMPRDSVLPINYLAVDDFGVSQAELMVMFDDDKAIANSCASPETLATGGQVWTGTTALDLSTAPAECQSVSAWLRIADNRPEEYGGPQVIESEAIQVALDDLADTLGQQQIAADLQLMEQSLKQAMEQTQAALAAAKAFQDTDDEQSEADQHGEAREESEVAQREADDGDRNENLNEPSKESRAEGKAENAEPKSSDARITAQHTQSGHPDAERLETDVPDRPTRKPVGKNDHVATMRRKTQQAKRTLDHLAEKIRSGSKLFQPKAKAIQKIADQEMTEALELANQIPLTDDELKQNQLAHDSQQELSNAIADLTQLRSDIEQQAQQMETAAQLDDLAAVQERIAREAVTNEQPGAPDKQWQDRQQAVGDKLQTLAEENAQTRHQQLLQRAEQADELAKQAQRLADHQQQLSDVVEKAEQLTGHPDQAKQQLQELIEAERREIVKEAQRAEQQPNDRTVRSEEEAQDQQQRLDQASKEAEAGRVEQAAARVQEQIAERAGQLQKAAEQLARQEDANTPADQRAQEAAKDLEQAKQRAELAKQALCEKCNGGAESPSNSKSEQGASAQEARSQASQQPQNGQQQRALSPKEAARPTTTAKQSNKINQEQQDAAQALQQAAQSLNKVCESCRECAKSGNPGSSKGSSGAPGGSPQAAPSPKSEPAQAKQLAHISDGAKRAAKSRSKQEAARNAEDVADRLNQLADEVAEASGYSLRHQNKSAQEPAKQSKSGSESETDSPSNPTDSSGQPAASPKGVGKVAGSTDLNGERLRGGSNSNWTRARRKLGSGVLDDREGNVPEQYRAIVQRYFEELSRQQSLPKEK